MDDAGARPGAAQSNRRARAEARLRPVPASTRADSADRRRRRLSDSRAADYLDRLAAFVAATRFDRLPAATVAAAKLVLLDTLGAIVAGSALPENGKLARLAAARTPHGGATLLGHRAKADPFWAALANVHSHGTWGTISTAVAVAKLDGAPAETIREVINLAASMSPANTWTPALEGATIRNLYPGRSAFQGILAVELQRCGFTGLDNAPSDVYGTILADAFDPALVVAGLDALGRADSAPGAYRI